MKKKILVLGGGLLQIPLIKMALQKGFKVHLSDYYENPPGRFLADGYRRISTFSVEDNLAYAREKDIDYILTIGTDQPVYTAACVSEKLGLSCPISAEQGLALTHKYYMKTIMSRAGVPSPRFRTARQAEDIRVSGLRYPIVLKPADSQGQRGIFVIDGSESRDAVEMYFKTALKFSRTGMVIMEEFYEGSEITVNCWVKEEQPYILMITDRLHFDDSKALGICKQQRFPSQTAAGREEEIVDIITKLVRAFKIKDGPLYVQAVVGSENVKIIEFGYRIGGGFESEIIPLVTGIDVVDLYFTLVTEGENKFNSAEVLEKVRLGSVFFMLAKPGIIKETIVPGDFETYGRLFVGTGTEISEIENATSRVGCFRFYTDSAEDYFTFLDKVDSETAILDGNNNDILIHGIWE